MKKQISLRRKMLKHFLLKRREILSVTGFTLVELLVSISIIAILSVVLSVSFSSAQKNGRDQRRIADLKAIQNAAEQYYLLNNGKYPISVNIAWTGPGAQMILAKFPTDPKAGVGVTVPYIRTLTASGYCVCSKVEKYSSGNSEGSNCTFGNAAINNCRVNPANCYYCVKNQQ